MTHRVLAVQKARAFDNRGNALGMTVDHRGPSQMRTLKEALDWHTTQARSLLHAPVALNDFMALAEWRELQQLQAQLGRRCAIEHSLLEFRQFSSQFEFANGEAYLAQLRDHWWATQERTCGNYDRPLDESLCSDLCRHNNWLLTLCPELHLSGCTEHGTLHRCQHRMRRCTAQYTTSNTTVVCLFSGEEIDKVTSSLSGASGGHEYNEGEAGASSRYRESMLEQQKMPSFTYFGSRAHSLPGSSVDTPSDRVAAVRQLFAAALSGGGGGGAGGGSSAKSYARMNLSFRFGMKVPEIQRAAEHRLLCVAKKVIDDVLYNKERRVLFNRVARQEAERQAAADVLAYYAQCKIGIAGQSVLPRRNEAAVIFATQYRRITLLPIVDEDRSMVARFEKLCARLWALCHRTQFARDVATSSGDGKQSRHSVRQTTCTYEQFCLGVLYSMRDGLTLRRDRSSAYGAAFGVGGGAVGSNSRGLLLCIDREYPFVPSEWRLHFELPPVDSVDAFSDRSAQEMVRHTELLSSTVSFGESTKVAGGSASSIFKADGTRKLRKKRQMRRVTTTGSGAKRVAFGRNLSVPERDILPPHLHSNLLQDTGYYEKSGVARGLNFLKRCLYSIPDKDIENESRALWF